mmetsp:Transcript_20474/g.20589  ORF Transcript_20474/g.20589 Transcript_20474/m.20589 type:complete len:100 (+) Transcript_20474:486-785(+)
MSCDRKMAKSHLHSRSVPGSQKHIWSNAHRLTDSTPSSSSTSTTTPDSSTPLSLTPSGGNSPMPSRSLSVSHSTFKPLYKAQSFHSKTSSTPLSLSLSL